MAASKSITRNFNLYVGTGLCVPSACSGKIKAPTDRVYIEPIFLTNLNQEQGSFRVNNSMYNNGSESVLTWYKPDPNGIRPSGASGIVNNFCLVFGDGDAPATKEDIKLASDICPLEDLEYSCCDIWMDPDGKFLFKIQATVTNISEETKIFKEMGLVCKADRSFNWNNLETEGYLLFAREVFEEPITLAPGDSRTFILTIDF